MTTVTEKLIDDDETPSRFHNVHDTRRMFEPLVDLRLEVADRSVLFRVGAASGATCGGASRTAPCSDQEHPSSTCDHDPDPSWCSNERTLDRPGPSLCRALSPGEFFSKWAHEAPETLSASRTRTERTLRSTSPTPCASRYGTAAPALEVLLPSTGLPSGCPLASATCATFGTKVALGQAPQHVRGPHNQILRWTGRETQQRAPAHLG